MSLKLLNIYLSAENGKQQAAQASSAVVAQARPDPGPGPRFGTGPAALCAALSTLLLLACVLAVLLAGGAPVGWAAEAVLQAPREHYRALTVAAPIHHINDGDTFEADLNGDGQLQFPRERVRLLYVDTPELGESHKGQDRLHGLPAQAALQALLTKRPLVLHVPRDEPAGKYGRTLALVSAGGVWVNRELIRLGHAPLDTRFSFPPDYEGYVAAEAEAFDAKRGIWSDAPSRKRYLQRLRQEDRTPAARSNALYVARVQDAPGFDPAAMLGRYVTLTAMLAERRTVSKGVLLLQLELGPGRGYFTAVVYRHRAAMLGTDTWVRGRRLRVEGFVKRYKGNLQIVVHHGGLIQR